MTNPDGATPQKMKIEKKLTSKNLKIFNDQWLSVRIKMQQDELPVKHDEVLGKAPEVGRSFTIPCLHLRLDLFASFATGQLRFCIAYLSLGTEQSTLLIALSVSQIFGYFCGSFLI